MRMIKVIAAFAALAIVAACSSEQKVPDAGTPVTPGSIADFKQNVGDRVFFDTDMSTIRPDGRATLDKQAAWLSRYGNYRILIGVTPTSAARANTTSRSAPAAPRWWSTTWFRAA